MTLTPRDIYEKGYPAALDIDPVTLEEAAWWLFWLTQANPATGDWPDHHEVSKEARRCVERLVRQGKVSIDVSVPTLINEWRLSFDRVIESAVEEAVALQPESFSD